MAEPITVDFKRRRRVDPVQNLQRTAMAVRMFLDRHARCETAVDVVLPDPIRGRSPYLAVTMEVVDTDLEERIERGWPTVDFDFVWESL